MTYHIRVHDGSQALTARSCGTHEVLRPLIVGAYLEHLRVTEQDIPLNVIWQTLDGWTDGKGVRHPGMVEKVCDVWRGTACADASFSDFWAVFTTQFKPANAYDAPKPLDIQLAYQLAQVARNYSALIPHVVEYKDGCAADIIRAVAPKLEQLCEIVATLNMERANIALQMEGLTEMQIQQSLTDNQQPG